MNDYFDDDAVEKTMRDTYKSIQAADDAAERGQDRNILYSIYLKLNDEKRTLEEAKQLADKEGNSTTHHIAQRKLELVNELLRIDGLENLGLQMESEPLERETATGPASNPRHLCVTVDDINNQVVVTDKGGKEKKTYSSYEAVGKGKETWKLLVAVAKCGGSLDGNKATDVIKLNTSGNRINLGDKLKDTMNLNESPILKGRPGVMCFHSISLAGSKTSTDALDRKTANYDDITSDDLASEFLASRGHKMPVDKD